MSQYQPTIREINLPHLLEVEIADGLTFVQFVQACGQDEQWIEALFAHDILSSPVSPQQHIFVSHELSRARRAYRLQRDFDASFSAVAVMLDLLDEVQQLRRRVADIESALT